MNSEIQLPTLPEPGFYYHYKHDPQLVREDCPDAAIRNYAYFVLPSFGHFTEETDLDSFQVDYIPLYPWAKVYQISSAVGRICEDHRPASMFLENANLHGRSVPRFTPITEHSLIKKLEEIKQQMYGHFPSK